MEVGHKCANCQCVNPAHLYLTTRKENNREVIYRGKYKYPSQVKQDALLHALSHAKYIKALWNIRNFDFTNLTQDKVIQIDNVIQDTKQDETTKTVEYKPPELHIMPCSHDAKYAIHEEEGTSWCIMCEYKVADETIEKLRKLLGLND